MYLHKMLDPTAGDSAPDPNPDEHDKPVTLAMDFHSRVNAACGMERADLLAHYIHLASSLHMRRDYDYSFWHRHLDNNARIDYNGQTTWVMESFWKLGSRL